jgi:hypothetical protein
MARKREHATMYELLKEVSDYAAAPVRSRMNDEDDGSCGVSRRTGVGQEEEQAQTEPDIKERLSMLESQVATLSLSNSTLPDGIKTVTAEKAELSDAQKTLSAENSKLADVVKLVSAENSKLSDALKSINQDLKGRDEALKESIGYEMRVLGVVFERRAKATSSKSHDCATDLRWIQADLIAAKDLIHSLAVRLHKDSKGLDVWVWRRYGELMHFQAIVDDHGKSWDTLAEWVTEKLAQLRGYMDEGVSVEDFGGLGRQHGRSVISFQLHLLAMLDFGRRVPVSVGITVGQRLQSVWRKLKSASLLGRHSPRSPRSPRSSGTPLLDCSLLSMLLAANACQVLLHHDLLVPGTCPI